MSETRTILRIDTSMRREGSISRRLTDRMVQRLLDEAPDSAVVTRDLSHGLPYVDPAFIEAKGAEARDPAVNPTLGLSLELIEELKRADTVVLGLPVYNFTMPAVFKSWVDLVALPRETFRYTADGPVGLLADRPVYVLFASGGTGLDSEIDFLSPWLRHVFGFLGITDLRFIAADRVMMAGDEAIAAAESRIDRLAA